MDDAKLKLSVQVGRGEDTANAAGAGDAAASIGWHILLLRCCSSVPVFLNLHYYGYYALCDAPSLLLQTC